MKIAITENNRESSVTSRCESSPIAKKTYAEKAAKLVPNFAARWHSFCKYFFTPDINTQRKQINATKTYRDNPFTN
jgi:hypothetical protein